MKKTTWITLSGLLLVCPLLVCPFLLSTCTAVMAPMTFTRFIASDDHALDNIMLSEISDEVGPLIFKHLKHRSPRSAGGNGIECRHCHHDYAGSVKDTPPRSCRTCHLKQDEATATGSELEPL